MIAMCPRADTDLTYMIDIALTMEFRSVRAVPDERWGLGHQVVKGGSHARRRGGGCGAG